MQAFETKRLIIRNFQKGNEIDLFQYLRTPTALCFLSLKLANLAEAELEFSKRVLDIGCLAISLKETCQLIGDLFGGAGECDEDETASVDWNINPNFEGQGYAIEAATGLFD